MPVWSPVQMAYTGVSLHKYTFPTGTLKNWTMAMLQCLCGLLCITCSLNSTFHLKKKNALASFLSSLPFEKWCTLKQIVCAHTLRVSRPICYRCCMGQYIPKGQFYVSGNVGVSAMMSGCLSTRRAANSSLYLACNQGICIGVKWIFS